MKPRAISFVATPEKGKVDALLQEAGSPVAILVLGHGAGANIHHTHMQDIAESLATAHVSTFRFNFPFMQSGGGRTDSIPICCETIAQAIRHAGTKASTPLFLGGHSFGGRMASHFAVKSQTPIRGLIYYSFPLHPAGKPGTKRAEHLDNITLPQLFLSGTRDALADLSLLRGVVEKLPLAVLHELDTADHSFKILKRSRTTTERVHDEAARVAARFIAGTLGRP